jgi:hypothetical protein
MTRPRRRVEDGAVAASAFKKVAEFDTGCRSLSSIDEAPSLAACRLGSRDAPHVRSMVWLLGYALWLRGGFRDELVPESHDRYCC